MRLAAVLILPWLLASGAVQAQEPPRCAASGETPVTAEQVIAAVRQANCPSGSRLQVPMTVAGQAIQLQMSGLCQEGSVRTFTWRPSLETRPLGFSCLIR